MTVAAVTTTATLDHTSHNAAVGWGSIALDELSLAAAEVLASSSAPEIARTSASASSLVSPVIIAAAGAGSGGSKDEQQQEQEEEHTSHSAVEESYNMATAGPSSSSKQTNSGNPSNAAKRRIKAINSNTTAGDSSSSIAADDTTATTNALSDGPKTKRKKVSKACIFCKRSHMTCTENRPCERCIKRDIAHLCQDGPITGTPTKASTTTSTNNNNSTPASSSDKGPSIAISNAGSISENDIQQQPSSSSINNKIRAKSNSMNDKSPSSNNNNTSNQALPHPPPSLSSLDDFPSATSAFATPSFQAQHHSNANRQQHHSDQLDDTGNGNASRDRGTSISSSSNSATLHGINNVLPTPNSSTSLLFGAAAGSTLFEEPQSSSSSISQQQQNNNNLQRGQVKSERSHSHSRSPAFPQQHQQQQQQLSTPQSLSNIHLQGPTNSSNNNISNQSSQQQQIGHELQQSQQQQKPTTTTWNPFDILSQAYDFQYPPIPSINNNDNSTRENFINNYSLASLRLFATTADAQFGKMNNNNNNNNSNHFNNNIGYNGLNSGTGGSGMSGLSLLNGNGGTFGSAGSENGTNSDIDGNALDEFLKSLDEMYLNPSPDTPQQTLSGATSTLFSGGNGFGPSQPAPSSSSSDPEKSQPHLLSNSTTAAQLAAASTSSTSRFDTQVTNSTAPSRSLSPINLGLELGGSSSGGKGNNSNNVNEEGGGNNNNNNGNNNATRTEKFLLTAADQKEGTRDERLNRVIRAKYDAGLLRPFNYIKGYERLNTWMEKKWSTSGKLRTLRIISEFRPHFRNIAQSLTDMDLIFIEEAFERLLLDYDRVFSTMGIPACLWRRTGEIFKGNREFAALVGIPYEQLRDGKLAIYELMTEDSAVNFWEKYGSIAFDPAQKAVLTSCVLVDQRKLKALQLKNSDNSAPTLSALSSTTQSNGNQNKDFVLPAASFSPSNIPEEARLTCTFSFTIRRDAYHIPNAIVGNFMPYDPKKVRS